ncbi:hypothetical protein EYF80_031672 [Liparis tanakae]|uniref:Uncharacterized protein n=1 Tax=Liparis tanakae TaxID=230148 RepID=A0A4Z2GXG4_9TELE|nr:hypothetical protein EYF80_031672 [Liparis tanakae]
MSFLFSRKMDSFLRKETTRTSSSSSSRSSTLTSSTTIEPFSGDVSRTQAGVKDHRAFLHSDSSHLSIVDIHLPPSLRSASTYMWISDKRSHRHG